MGILSLGEALVEFYRKKVDIPLYKAGKFVGPYAAGAPAIFADTVARLGSPSKFLGVIGNDDFGKVIQRKFEEDKVDTSSLRVSKSTTATAFVSYFKDGSRKFLFHLNNSAAGELSPEDVRASNFEEMNYLHITGSTLSINKSCRKAIYESVEKAKEKNLVVSFDPNVRLELMDREKIKKICQPVFRNCDYLLPNEKEIRTLSGEEDLEKASRQFLDMGMDSIILKRGNKGSEVFTSNDHFEVPSFDIEEVDPTGAGDSFNAGFIHSLFQGKDLKEATIFANAVGALCVSKQGGTSGASSAEEVEKFLDKHQKKNEGK